MLSGYKLKNKALAVKQKSTGKLLILQNSYILLKCSHCHILYKNEMPDQAIRAEKYKRGTIKQYKKEQTIEINIIKEVG